MKPAQTILDVVANGTKVNPNFDLEALCLEEGIDRNIVADDKQSADIKVRKLFENQIDPDFFTDYELAAKLNVSVNTIRKWRYQENIPYHKFGRSVRYRLEEVIEALKRSSQNEK